MHSGLAFSQPYRAGKAVPLTTRHCGTPLVAPNLRHMISYFLLNLRSSLDRLVRTLRAGLPTCPKRARKKYIHRGRVAAASSNRMPSTGIPARIYDDGITQNG